MFALLALFAASAHRHHMHRIQPAEYSSNTLGDEIVSLALSKKGCPYVYGASGPSSFDCSGLVMWCFSHYGISLPHDAEAQANYGTYVDSGSLQPGDLVFFGDSIYHVGIYIGDGEFVHAPKPGDRVKVTRLEYMPEYNCARRLW